MLLASIKNLAADYATEHRWCKVNLTDDDGNDFRPEKLAQRRIVGIGRKYVRVIGYDGKAHEVHPNRIQQVW
jgi:hypothetical protein